ncbi:MAG: heat shock protein HspQ [Hyphomicrobiaceae bacterium]|nr:MAG: heat shock protein HspQ [Hyphomicrobiaceae bacterium]
MRPGSRRRSLSTLPGALRRRIRPEPRPTASERQQRSVDNGHSQFLSAVRLRRGERNVQKAKREAKFGIGQVVRHRIHPFRGVIFDVDPVFANSEDWWQSIPPETRPRKDQPFYHLLAENAETTYVAYVSEQNLLPDETGAPVHHPQVAELFGKLVGGQYEARFVQRH